MNQEELVRVPGSAATKASNALVATVDFYSRELANREALIAQQSQVIEQIGAQLRKVEARANDAENEHAKLLDELASKAKKRKLPRGARAVLAAAAELMKKHGPGYKAAERGTPAHDLYVATLFIAKHWRGKRLPAGTRHFLEVAKTWASSYEMEPDSSDRPAHALYEAIKALRVVEHVDAVLKHADAALQPRARMEV